MASRSSGLISEDCLQQFCCITGVTDRSIAQHYLEACDSNVELAIGMHMDSGSFPGRGAEGAVVPASEGSTGGGPSQDSSLSDVRAPIPQCQEVLVEEAVVLPGRRWRRPKPRSVFDGFRDFQAETMNLSSAAEGSTSTSDGGLSRKLKTLEDLFRPPVDIMHKGSFSTAREAGTSANKWLLVNIQNAQEFSCQSLNRDVWSNSLVKDIINEHFIFWQVYSESEDGARYMQFYRVHEWPYVAIIDPRTGENMISWNKLDAESFTELVSQFLSEHLVPDPSLDSTPSCSQPTRISNNNSGRKRLRGDETLDSLLDHSEEAQLRAVLKASMFDTGSSTTQPKHPRLAIPTVEEQWSDDALETFSDSDDDSAHVPSGLCDPSGASGKITHLEAAHEIGRGCLDGGTSYHEVDDVGPAGGLTSDALLTSSKNHLSNGDTTNRKNFNSVGKKSGSGSYNGKVVEENKTRSACLNGLNNTGNGSIDNGHGSKNESSNKIDSSSKCDMIRNKAGSNSIPSLESIDSNRLGSGASCSEGGSTMSASRNAVADNTGPMSCLLLRFPEGSRKQLKLLASSSIKELHSEVSRMGYPSTQYELITTYPRLNLSTIPSSSTLQELQLFPQATIFIQQLVSTDED